MNEQQRAKLADNLTAMADGWTLAEVDWIISLLLAIRNARHAAKHRAADKHRASSFL